FGNHSTASQNGDVLQHFLATVTETRRLHSVDLHDAAHVVDHQSSQGFAFDVFSDDLQRLASLCNRFQHRQQFADVGDLLVNQQDVRVFQLGRHVVLVVDEVRDRKSTRLNSSHVKSSYAVFCLQKKRR